MPSRTWAAAERQARLRVTVQALASALWQSTHDVEHAQQASLARLSLSRATAACMWTHPACLALATHVLQLQLGPALATEDLRRSHSQRGLAMKPCLLWHSSLLRGPSARAAAVPRPRPRPGYGAKAAKARGPRAGRAHSCLSVYTDSAETPDGDELLEYPVVRAAC